MTRILVLVTGAAGFIGFHVARRLLAEGDLVTGVDSLNDCYDPGLKGERLAEIGYEDGFDFRRLYLANGKATSDLFAGTDRDVV